MRETAISESEMCAAPSPQPVTEDDLVSYVASLVDRQHDYGTCVYAMSLAACAAFNYVAHKLGITGFQASCADMDFIRRTRRLDGPFGIINAQDMLYPQCDIRGRTQEWISGWSEWAAERASAKLRATSRESVHPDVWAHWERLSRNRAGGNRSDQQ